MNSAFSAMWYFFNLYIRALAWDFILIGSILSFTAIIGVFMQLIGGYIGDIIDRKKLAVAAFVVLALYHILIGLFADIIPITAALILLAFFEVVKNGSTALIMENIPRKQSGVGLSLYPAGRIFGIIILILFALILPIFGFTQSFRTMYLIAGISLSFCAFSRFYFVESSTREKKDRDKPMIMDFFSETKKTAIYILTAIPGVTAVVLFDGISDTLFKFAALIYLNEFLGIDILGINLTVFLTIVFSVPLVLTVGRMTDQYGTRKSAFLVYSIMPISVTLLLLAPSVPIYIEMIAFIAVLLKYINDVLWGVIIQIFVRRNLPQQDTAKFLAIFAVIIALFKSIGPFIAGLIFEFYGPVLLFIIILGLNITILFSILKIKTESQTAIEND